MTKDWKREWSRKIPTDWHAISHFEIALIHHDAQHDCYAWLNIDNLTLQETVLWHRSSCVCFSLWTCMWWRWLPQCMSQLFSPDATLCTLHTILHFMCGEMVCKCSLDWEWFGTHMTNKGTFILMNMPLVSIQCAGISKPINYNSQFQQSFFSKHKANYN